MSRLKFSTGLFLEKAELERFNKFIQDDGFIKYFLSNSTKFGLIKNQSDGSFDNAKVSESTSLTLNINEISAFDQNGNYIYYPAVTELEIPTTDDWYWIKIKYLQSNNEVGLYSIDTSGNLVCTTGNGEFLSILRGQPNFPSRVKLIDSTNNLLEYDVLEVIDNNNAILQGDFISESDLKLVVVGTFATGFVVDSSDKDIFLYNSCTLSFENELTLNTAPSKIEGEEFYIARVAVSGGSVFIEDKRNEIYQSKDGFDIATILSTQNPLFGVEKINFDHSNSTREKNIIQIAWNLRSTTWSFNSKLNLVTINSGEGGRYKPADVSLFTDGDLDGWRVYTSNGKYSLVTSSSKSGGQINLYLNKADLDDFTDTTQEITVTPDVEEIEITCKADTDDANDLPTKIETFPINQPFARFKVLAYKQLTPALYNISYRYKNNHTYSSRLYPLADLIGFYAEDQFNESGVLNGSPTRTTYSVNTVSGFIPVTMASDAYTPIIDSLTTGDLLGVQTYELDVINQVKQLYVGTNKVYQYIADTGSSAAPTIATLSQDLYFNLNSTKLNGSTLKQGNKFIVHIQQPIIFGSYNVRFVQNYVNTSVYDLIHEINVDVESYLSYENNFSNGNQDGLFLVFTYTDENEWIVKTFGEKVLDELIAPWKKISDATGYLLTSNAETWTVGAASDIDYLYKRVGNTVQVSCTVRDSTISGVCQLRLMTPESWTCRTGFGSFVGSVGIVSASSFSGQPFSIIDAADNYFKLYFTATAGTLDYITLNATFEMNF